MYLNEHLHTINFLPTFGVSNAKQNYDYFLWLETDRTNMEWN